MVQRQKGYFVSNVARWDFIWCSGLPTIPSTLADEKRTNPFMRVHQRAVIDFTNQSDDPVAVMKELRARKDAFGLGSGPRL